MVNVGNSHIRQESHKLNYENETLFLQSRADRRLGPPRLKFIRNGGGHLAESVACPDSIPWFLTVNPGGATCLKSG